ncbi:MULTISPECIES: conjugal transfer protein TraL [unclassified Neisseria]|uniref:conjugal transfer protein TraL n=1 Tax=unclassified Neisseria TaxID=2623750 RepID=UPI0010727B02|nr:MULTISPECIES: conjugal transfer protein TraL [unclassified Neisseria]MBF0804915.1 conjugal transfer protein TraL [Neisseria sp. 19428wB4_WF04]TFU39379.1 conjugal transfer protein TraL [Neisseria sp. WF04]
MKEAHLIVQGKGGVGKSFSAMIVAQYLKAANDGAVYCFDTDPVNQTFGRFGALQAETVNILTADNTIDTRNFDGLIEKLIENEGMAVVDNGAATFVPLMSYIAENHVDELLKENGVRLILHVPVMGGQALEDCAVGLAQTAKTIDAEIVVWLNEHNGAIRLTDGKGFTDLPVYKNNQAKIIGIVHLPHRNPDTFGRDIQAMTAASLTFEEADKSPEFGIMPRQRLRTVKRDLFAQLEKLPVWVNRKP